MKLATFVAFVALASTAHADVFLLESQAGSGTGVALANTPQGCLGVTANHAISPSMHTPVNGKNYRVVALKRWKQSDTAAIFIVGYQAKREHKVSLVRPKKGDKFWVSGFPYRKFQYFRASMINDSDGANYFWLDRGIETGGSGGAIARNNTIYGIVSAIDTHTRKLGIVGDTRTFGRWMQANYTKGKVGNYVAMSRSVNHAVDLNKSVGIVFSEQQVGTCLPGVRCPLPQRPAGWALPLPIPTPIYQPQAQARPQPVNGADGLPGEPGKEGKPGKSAYQSAVEAGYKGTEAQWASSIGAVDEKKIQSLVDKAVDNRVKKLLDTTVPFRVFKPNGELYSEDANRKAFDPIEIKLAEPKKQ